jgi:hypothetical protein
MDNWLKNRDHLAPGILLTMRKVLEIGAWSLAFLLLCPRLAHAYIDPGAGSALVQSVLAILVAGGFLVRQFAARIRSAAARLFTRNERR